MKLVTQLVRENRRADIGTVLGKFNVVLYEQDKQVRIVEVHEHSESYAMDVAQNWINRIIKE